ncbi:YdcF family protein [Erythrobacter insulae]|uniref:YdcF family protein n=1 Tax=Erythrobacter insulae TaxID=2584124 RepID=A0A547PA51_9SPHN|nr:YdcF family protein [Erythrobacter insulae]TRD11016.1 YdcF family protein [Erythrobacter insulae]
MIKRALSAMVLIWALGFLWFVVALPQPADDLETDAVVVPTGGEGRIAQGLAVLDAGLASKLLVSGVDREVKPGEFAAQFDVDQSLLDCCITLGFAAVDTRSNASEIAQWAEDNDVSSLRLVTTDWHMRRAAGELSRTLPENVTVIRDAVPSEPSFSALFLEYHKLLASWTSGLIGL